MSVKIKWAVVAQYEHMQYQAGEIISLHKTYELAEKAALDNGMQSIRDVPASAKKGDYWFVARFLSDLPLKQYTQWSN